ncbi:DUF488 domain-containing protein [Acinetobacter sp. WZC-1]|uniref:DUF488 domain-containing protein n=1 Tax=Acinetobacter sp. WZC-1 TaxID=3459034 RepID=UPI00403DDDA2
MDIRIKRAYVAPSAADGKRMLVDRLWPRGIKKQDADIDLWPKEITPSTELRKWYHEDTVQRWEEFQQRYRAELMQYSDRIRQLREMATRETVTLITAAKNETHNHATVLKQLLEEG